MTQNADKRIDVLGWGVVAVDDVFHVPHYPAVDTKVRATHYERRIGGLTSVALIAAADLDGCVAYAGVLGDDNAARFVKESLADAGVDISAIVPQDGARPVIAAIAVSADNDSRTIFYTVEGRVERGPDAELAELLAQSRVVLIDPFSLVAAPALLPVARETGVQVVVDLEVEHVDRFRPIAGQIDHMVAPLPAAQKWTGLNDPARAACALAQGRRAGVVTMGRDGSVYAEGDAAHIVPVFDVETRNTTGCGDVFHGAYSLGIARGMSVGDATRFASAAAAVRAEDRRGNGGAIDADRVRELLEE